jgi:hypothetical protein
MTTSVQSKNFFYKINIVWQREEKKKDYDENIIKQNIILDITSPAINDYFISNSDNEEDMKRLMYWILRHKFPRFGVYFIYKINYKQIDSKDIENTNEIFLIDIYDMANMFDFNGFENETIDKKKLNQPSETDFDTLKKTIQIIKTKNYSEYRKNIELMNPTLVHTILQYIPIDDYKIIRPLFEMTTNVNTKNPLIFSKKTQEYPYIEYENYDKSNRDERLKFSFLEDDAKYRINKFIIIVLIDAIKSNESELCNQICKHTDLDRGVLLFNYCIEVANENNKENLIPIFEEYIQQADSDSESEEDDNEEELDDEEELEDKDEKELDEESERSKDSDELDEEEYESESDESEERDENEEDEEGDDNEEELDEEREESKSKSKTEKSK